MRSPSVTIAAHEIALLDFFAFSCERYGLKLTAEMERLLCRVAMVKVHQKRRIRLSAVQAVATSLGYQDLFVSTATFQHGLSVAFAPALLTSSYSLTTTISPTENQFSDFVAARTLGLHRGILTRSVNHP